MRDLNDFFSTVKELQVNEDDQNLDQKIIKEKLKNILNYSVRELLAIRAKPIWNRQAYKMASCNKDIVDLLFKKYQHLYK